MTVPVSVSVSVLVSVSAGLTDDGDADGGGVGAVSVAGRQRVLPVVGAAHVTDAQLDQVVLSGDLHPLRRHQVRLLGTDGERGITRQGLWRAGRDIEQRHMCIAYGVRKYAVSYTQRIRTETAQSACIEAHTYAEIQPFYCIKYTCIH